MSEQATAAHSLARTDRAQFSSAVARRITTRGLWPHPHRLTSTNAESELEVMADKGLEVTGALRIDGRICCQEAYAEITRL
jgi:hypothetical protein